MKVLYVVQPLTGDRIDDNHIRVEHHHSQGLTYTDCLIDGVVREVRSTSRIDRRHPVTKSPTILVHLKPLPKIPEMRLTCAHIPTHQILMSVAKGNKWPSLSEYRKILMLPSFSGERLTLRKERTLVRKGYVITTNGVPFTTAKGRRYLERVHART